MQNDQIIIYKTENGETAIDVKLVNDTVWLTQSQLAELFETDRTSLVKHIKNIYKTGELNESSTCAKIAQVQNEGLRVIKRDIAHYNLDLIISVGYKVNSVRGTQFRIWANNVLKDHLIKGTVIKSKFLDKKSIFVIQRSSVMELS